MGVRITWTDNNTMEDGHRIYRSTSSIDPDAPPAALADIGPDETHYDDGTGVDGQGYYYRVSAYAGSAEQFSDEVFIVYGASEVDPASLFTSGEYGAWYDFSDITTLWQVSTRVTSVSADGDPIGYVDDKSGNNLDLYQPTTVYRPVYKTDGTLHWGLGDGVNDWLYSTAALANRLLEGGGLVMAASFVTDTVNNNGVAFETADGDIYDPANSLAENNRIGVFHDARASGSASGVATPTGGGGSGEGAIDTDENYNGSAHVIALNWNGTNWDLWFDGVKQSDTSITSTADFANRANRRLNLFRQFVGPRYQTGGIYQALFHEDGQSDATVIGLTNYFKSKAGI